MRPIGDYRPARSYKVSAHAAGFAIKWFNNLTGFASANVVNVASGADFPGVNFALAGAAGGISGRITQLDGVTGIPNAVVTVRSLTSDLVYSASGNVVDSVICDGRVIMRQREVANEREILADARRAAQALFARL